MILDDCIPSETTMNDIKQSAIYLFQNQNTINATVDISQLIKKETWVIVTDSNCPKCEEVKQKIIDSGGDYFDMDIEIFKMGFSDKDEIIWDYDLPIITRNDKYVSSRKLSNVILGNNLIFSNGYNNFNALFPNMVDEPLVTELTQPVPDQDIMHTPSNKVFPQTIQKTYSIPDDFLNENMRDNLFINSTDCGPSRRYTDMEEMTSNLNTPEELLLLGMEFFEESFIAKGDVGDIFNVSNVNKPTVVKKMSIHNFKEITSYKIASHNNIGPQYYGWGICRNNLFIFMEKIPYKFSLNGPNTNIVLLKFILKIAKTGYFSADFHSGNIMLRSLQKHSSVVTTNFVLIDPSLISITNFLEEMKDVIDDYSSYYNDSQDLISIGMFFMLKRITGTYGGINLNKNPNLRETINTTLLNKRILVLNKGRGQYKNFEPSDI
ncbi:MAG: hypothetical protein JKX76_02560 [Colwellia sp.]|nr:hypothetical protein [Colwellia sp.]